MGGRAFFDSLGLKGGGLSAFFVEEGWFNTKNRGKCKKVWAVFGKSEEM